MFMKDYDWKELQLSENSEVKASVSLSDYKKSILENLYFVI